MSKFKPTFNLRLKGALLSDSLISMLQAYVDVEIPHEKLAEEV